MSKYLLALSLVAIGLVGCEQRAPAKPLTDDQCVLQVRGLVYDRYGYDVVEAVQRYFPECDRPEIYKRALQNLPNGRND